MICRELENVIRRSLNGVSLLMCRTHLGLIYDKCGGTFIPGSFLSMIVGLLVVAGAIQSASAQTMSLLRQLTTEGIAISEDVKVAMPPPLLMADLTTTQQQAAFGELSGNDGWARFSRDSVVAPVTIELEYIKDKQEQRIGHLVHSAYAVHAKLEVLKDKDLMRQLFATGQQADASDAMSFVQLTAIELEQLGIQVHSENTTYGRMTLLLLGKIQLQGIIQLEKLESSAGVTMSWILNSPLSKIDGLQATWTKLEENELGESRASKPQPYKGLGGYLSVRRVAEAPEILVIESRMVMHEPKEWFSGSNFIRSKLPLGIQEGARNLRRRLKARQ